MGQLRWGRLGVGQETMFKYVDLTARKQTESNGSLTGGRSKKWQERMMRVNFDYSKSLGSGWPPEAEIVLKRN